MSQKNKYIGFNCPADLYDWLKEKQDIERRNLSSSVVHALQTAKEAEQNKCISTQSN